VFVSSFRLSDLETGFLVGFLEAEAHFAIRPPTAANRCAASRPLCADERAFA